jgi:perosamine synthetase
VETHLKLEEEFSVFCGLRAVACSSGTAALHLALEALQLPLGSEVLVPDYTMVACARAVAMAGLVPVFVDCGDDLLMDPGAAEGAVSYRTSAIMAVHVYGRQCDTDSLAALARSRGLKLLEDMAEAPTLQVHQWTDAACWSFYRNKVIAGEEGGAAAFRSSEHVELARCLRSHGFTAEHDFHHVPRGCSYRLADSLAELVLQSLRRVDSELVRRERAAEALDTACPRGCMMPARDVPWVYDLRVEDSYRAVARMGPAARHRFNPMSEQREFRACRTCGDGNARRLARRIAYVPMSLSSVPLLSLL